MKKALIAIALVTVSALGARADIVAAWDVSGHGTPSDATLNATTVNGGLISNTPALVRTGVTANNTGNSFASTNWNITNTFDMTNKYVSFDVTAATAITLTDLQYAINGSGTGPGTGEWGYSVNGGSFVFQPSFTISASLANATWDFNDVSLNAGDQVEFRFWAFGTTSISGGTSSSTGSIRVPGNLTSGNDLVLDGIVAAVPEPTTIGLITLGLAGVVAFARRRKA